MPKVKQLSVSHENRPGMLAEIATALGDQKVNILSCLTTTSGTEGTTHLLVDNVNKARKALGTRSSATRKQTFSVLSWRTSLGRWENSRRNSPTTTSTSTWDIRRAPRARARRAWC